MDQSEASIYLPFSTKNKTKQQAVRTKHLEWNLAWTEVIIHKTINFAVAILLIHFSLVKEFNINFALIEYYNSI